MELKEQINLYKKQIGREPYQPLSTLLSKLSCISQKSTNHISHQHESTSIISNISIGQEHNQLA